MKLANARRALGRIPSRITLARQLGKMQQDENVFFVILMPAGGHIASLAIEKVNAVANIVLIANGLCEEEVAWFETNYPRCPLISVGQTLHHHQVINSILMNWRQNFGLLDYDCFVTDPAVIQQLTNIPEDAAFSTAYSIRNTDLELVIPETFLVFLNAKRIQELVRKYQVDARIYFWPRLKGKTREAIEAMGIRPERMPETNKPYFDTLRVLMLLSLSEGLRIERVRQFEDPRGEAASVFHVGSISRPGAISDTYSFGGSYFWARALESCAEPVLEKIASARHGAIESGQLVSKYPEYYAQQDNELLEFIDRLLEPSG
jgi:hypothetical protein